MVPVFNVSKMQSHVHWLKKKFEYQFTSVPWLIGSSRGHEGRFSRYSLPVFPAGGPCEQFWHGQGCPLFDGVHSAFPLQTTASPTHQGALRDGFGEAVVESDMQESWKFLSLDSCQRFLWTHKGVDLVPHSVVGLVLQVGDEEFPQALDFEGPDLLFSQQTGSMFHSHRGGWRRQETFKLWTCLWSWWCCTAKS